MPALQMTNWYGVLVPAGTPPETKKRLEAALHHVVHQADVAAKLSEAGFSNPKDSTGFGARLQADFERWLPWLKEAQIRTD
jgi:tripartite-type tricarboxylate transporter receptor subunit TctC